jgi:hypothetical protein
MALGSIPWSSIQRWAGFHGITDPDDVATLEFHIRAMEKAARDLEKKKEATK